MLASRVALLIAARSMRARLGWLPPRPMARTVPTAIRRRPAATTHIRLVTEGFERRSLGDASSPAQGRKAQETTGTIESIKGIKIGPSQETGRQPETEEDQSAHDGAR